MAYPFVQAFHDLGPARGPRLAMCWHMAEGGGTVGFLSRSNPNGVSVHFVVETSGRIVQMLRLDHMHSSIRTSDIRTSNDSPYTFQGEEVIYGRTPAKAALGDWADIAHGTLGPNHATIGVEVEGYAANGPNMAQTASIANLAADMDLPANLGHRDFADYKACPGKRFPWPASGGHGKVEADMIPVVNGAPFTVKLRVGVQLYDQAFRPLVKVSTEQDAPGYFSTGTGYYSLSVVTSGRRQMVFVKTADAQTTPLPGVDCADEVAADRAKARIVYT